MFETKNDVINSITFADITKVTRKLNSATDIQRKREVMECFIDPVILEALDDKTANVLFEKMKNSIENKIRSIIKKETGQAAFPIGTKVRLTRDFGNFSEGTEGIITDCTRFEEDTFSQGWYAYNVKVPNESPVLYVYPYEFNVVDENKPIIQVYTPDGVLEAKQMPDDNYPGICISLISESNKELSAVIMEYNPVENGVMLRVYGPEDPDGEPRTIIRMNEEKNQS